MEKIEISVVFPDGSSFEYYSYTIPREGEEISFDHQHAKGDFVVKKVRHRVFASIGQTMTYVEIHLDHKEGE